MNVLDPFGTNRQYRNELARRSRGPLALLGGVIAMLVFLAVPATAQESSTTGAIAGRALDNTGSQMTGVQIVLRNVDTGVQRMTTTNDAGRFIFALLPPGN